MIDDLEPKLTRLVLGPLQTNCYVLACPQMKKAIVVDPADEPEAILGTAQKGGLHIETILLTHAHPDHLAALPEVKRSTKARVLMHRLDADLLRRYGHYYGLEKEQIAELLPEVQLEGGEDLTVGNVKVDVIHTPGHSPGSVTLRAGTMLLTGDTLFAQGVGRVDLPGGDWDKLLESIQHLFTLPEEYTVHPGHGPSSTIGREKRTNPYA